VTDVSSRLRPPARRATEGLAAVRRQRASLGRTDHRPFPLPRGPWIMGQSWADLLFAHWEVPESALRAAVPARIPIDTFQGSAWIGITPFEVVGAHPRAMPPLPWLSRFPELNVRTYTTIDGDPGIWFFSLDAARAAAVAGARLTYQLPYRHARMAIGRVGSHIAYRSRARTPPPSCERATSPWDRRPARRQARSRTSSPSATASTPSIATTACDAPTSTTRPGRCNPPTPTSPRTP
jgi:hypothetical protein